MQVIAVAGTVSAVNRLQCQAMASQRELIILARHPWCVTLGLACPEDQTYQWPGLAVERVDRGGGETIHYPGQIAAYCVINLRDRGITSADYMARLLAAAADLAGLAGVPAQVNLERSGVFVPDGGKLACTGLRKERGWSRWGMSVNVEGDLTPARPVAICSDSTIRLTTLQEQGSDWSWDQAAESLGLLLARSITQSEVSLVRNGMAV